MLIFLGIIAGYVYSTAMEWVVHNWVYHRLGKKLGGMLNFHLKEHHRDTSVHRGIDPAIVEGKLGWNAHGREAIGLTFLVLVHSPIVLVSPAFFATLCGMAILYRVMHVKSHQDPEWCKRYMPWHWEHHFGADPHANWCITSDWFDRLVGTRKRYPHLFEEEQLRSAA